MQPDRVARKILQIIRHPFRQAILPYYYSFLAAGANLSPEIADYIVPLFVPK